MQKQSFDQLRHKGADLMIFRCKTKTKGDAVTDTGIVAAAGIAGVDEAEGLAAIVTETWWTKPRVILHFAISFFLEKLVLFAFALKR